MAWSHLNMNLIQFNLIWLKLIGFIDDKPSYCVFIVYLTQLVY